MGALSVSAEIAHGVALTEKYPTWPISGQRGKGVFFRADPGFLYRAAIVSAAVLETAALAQKFFCF